MTLVIPRTVKRCTPTSPGPVIDTCASGNCPQGLFHPFRPHLGRSFPRCPPPPADSDVWMFPLLGQPFYPRPDAIGALLQSSLEPKVIEEAKRANEQESA